MINFVSHLPRDLRSGGFSAMNVAALEALERRYAVNYAGPVSLPPSPWSKGLSKLLRVAGLPGDYAFYSRGRLRRIAAEVEARRRPRAAFDFFHGFTHWVLTRPGRYAAWSDCTFRDYIDIYHRRADFRAADLARIEAAEAAWLKGAAAVAFTSAWAAGRAVADYGLDPARVHVVGIFGETDLPQADLYDGASQFAFVSTAFAAKGGPVVLEAFRRVRAQRPDATLVIVGDSPAQAAEPGVTLAGFLRKEDAAQNARLRDVLGRSRAVVHPTRSDIAPLLAVEAAYFGCPVISSRRFAIPEIVDDGRTGLLLDDPTDPAAVADAMLRLLEDEAGYRAMRAAAWAKSRRDHTRTAFEDRLLASVEGIDGGA